MIAKVVEARHLGAYRVWLKFADGLSGEIDLAGELWGPVFETLRDEQQFSKLMVDPELDTVLWPNGADFSPDWLYERVQAGNRDQSAAE